ncbi:MAG TPA: NADH-quinone oxidoreductase subunit H, partial [Clostridia bacterium]|nr:NADH-quinone oxidoreductase subunit H [Clostridia bacterium]
LALLAALFLPVATGIPALDFILFIIKTLAALFVLIVARAATARLRINQIVAFCWRYLTPVAFAQIVLNLILRSVLPL